MTAIKDVLEQRIRQRLEDKKLTDVYPDLKETTQQRILQVEVFECDHPIPTISYGFSETKQKLKDQYKSLPGKEIGRLRKEGNIEITLKVINRPAAYVCDTSIDVFGLNPTMLAPRNIFIGHSSNPFW